jgi:hypothetical protein
MANAGLALRFSDSIESALGLKPTNEELNRVLPKLRIVEEGKTRQDMSPRTENK